MKGYDKFPFEERKRYEETFVENNPSLIKDLTSSQAVFSQSQTDLDIYSGTDIMVRSGRDIWGVALRIRSPRFFKWAKNFSLGMHISKPNSQVHSVLNSISDKEIYYPHFILQINGVEEDGYCKECWAIKIQTNVFARILFKYKEDNVLEDYYKTYLDAYEFGFRHTFEETHTGVDVYHIKENQIQYYVTNADTKNR